MTKLSESVALVALRSGGSAPIANVNVLAGFRGDDVEEQEEVQADTTASKTTEAKGRPEKRVISVPWGISSLLKVPKIGSRRQENVQESFEFGLRF
jgi:hypothetical protein